jgi:hypothetical protein
VRRVLAFLGCVDRMMSFSCTYTNTCVHVSRACMRQRSRKARLQRGVEHKIHDDARNQQRVVLREGQRVKLRQQRGCAGEQPQGCRERAPARTGALSVKRDRHDTPVTVRTDFYVADEHVLLIARVQHHLQASSGV